jgi:hypothetical protein
MGFTKTFNDMMYKLSTLDDSEFEELKSLLSKVELPTYEEYRHYEKADPNVVTQEAWSLIGGLKPQSISIENNPELTIWIENYTKRNRETIGSIHIMDYPLNSSLKPHYDPKSKTTFAFLLTAPEEGGRTTMEGRILDFKEGQVLEYNGTKVLHGVEEVTKGIRKSLIVWYNEASSKIPLI